MQIGMIGLGRMGANMALRLIAGGHRCVVFDRSPKAVEELTRANAGKRDGAVDAETTPLRSPEHYQYDFDLRDIAEVWRRGSVVASWLLDLTAAALVKDPGLSDFSGKVSDSGEGRWTLNAAIDEGVPAPVLSAALYQRFTSRGEADYEDRVLSAMRFAFGGHLEKPGGGERGSR